MKMHVIDRLIIAVLTLCVVMLLMQMAKELWSGYRLAIYAVPTCAAPAAIPAQAMSVNPFAEGE